MRRRDKEITDHTIIESLIKKAIVCRIAFSDNNIPYIVPMNYAYKNNNIYLHSSSKGKKIEILKKNNNVCFEIDLNQELHPSEIPCNWTMKYDSVIGQGTANFIEDFQEKKKVLNILMKKYSNKASWKYSDDMVEKVSIIKVIIDSFTGKRSNYNIMTN